MGMGMAYDADVSRRLICRGTYARVESASSASRGDRAVTPRDIAQGPKPICGDNARTSPIYIYKIAVRTRARRTDTLGND